MKVTDKDEGLNLLSEFTDATAADLTDLEDIQSQDELQSGTPKKVKGIATAVALLLAAFGIVAIAYAHFKPQAGVESSERANVPSLVADKPPTAHVVGRILKQTVERARQLQQVSGGAQNAQNKIQEVENGIRELEESTPENTAATVHKHRDMIIAAINDMGDRNVQEVADKGEAITSRMLQEINGLKGTPELVQANLSKNGDYESTGDMVFQMKKVFGANGKARRLWAGDLFPDKGKIGYCYHTKTPQEVRNSFQRAINHIMNLVSCINFVEVPNLGDHWCQNNGIFITARLEGCYAYVGKIAQVQQLNLQPGGCDSLGIAAHEVLHSLGMTHEQARSDFNQYVTINWENIDQNMANNYEMNPKGDTSLPYDILSLMHYGDTDFSSNGQKTMKAVMLANGQKAAAGGVMGQRMGMSGYDATQLANMYSCPVQKFSLCTNDQTKCTKEPCVCHEYSGSPIIKVPDRDAYGNPEECWRCSKRCPDITQGSCDLGCDCGAGYVRAELQMANGGVCYACQLGTPLNQKPPEKRLRNPPPASNPNDPCVFPTSPDSCPQKRMPGCTNCDGQNAPAWCFMKPVNGQGRYRDCKKSDNACLFPFTYNDVERYGCITEGDENGGLPWCMKFGGGWKYCGAQEGYEGSVPVEAYGAGPTPAPKSESTKETVAVAIAGIAGGGGSSR